MNSLTVRLAPWAIERITRNYLKPGGKVTKAALVASLRDMPDTEFTTVAQPGVRAGMTLTVREAREHGFTHLSVRMNGDRDQRIIDCADGRVS